MTGPAERQLNKLTEGTAAAIVEFLLGALLGNRHRLGGELQRELAWTRLARRGVYRIVYEIAEQDRLVIVYRIEHRSTAYRQRYPSTVRISSGWVRSEPIFAWSIGGGSEDMTGVVPIHSATEGIADCPQPPMDCFVFEVTDLGDESCLRMMRRPSQFTTDFRSRPIVA